MLPMIQLKASLIRKSNYAFKPIAEQALRPSQTIVPQRLNAALGVFGSLLVVGTVTTYDFRTVVRNRKVLDTAEAPQAEQRRRVLVDKGVVLIYRVFR